ncbi:RelA/SpoT domain-containing protein [Paenibacillus oryzisoli]|uniref:RelA/SpoT domain-containing protein n=1 Tax=Paenibacillus oryzisoli TaxID=1850517 RepID=UPI003D2CD37D
MTLDREHFFLKYKIDASSFEKTDLDWAELQKIFDDFIGKYEQLSQAARMAAEGIRTAPGVHSIRYRVKDPEHLIEKIIRKKIKDPSREINSETYFSEITDLIGIRALHLFKDDWFPIHQYILNTWELNEPPKTFIREGDIVPDIYRQHTNVEPHEFGYRSVHYLIKNKPYKDQLIMEVQVRTIFEEGWSEIDHTIRYPYDLDNQTFNSFLQIFNRLAGSADEMGTYINFLKNELDLKDKRHKDELEEKNNLIESLESTVSKISALSAKEKNTLLAEINTLKQKVNTSPTWSYSGTSVFSPLGITINPQQGISFDVQSTVSHPGLGKWIGGAQQLGTPGLPSSLTVRNESPVKYDVLKSILPQQALKK